MDRGWSLKSLHRLIVTSATYRQSSRATPQQYREDPYNRLLARGPRFRVDAEVVRDIALAASGLLRPEVGGPSVYSPAPEFLFVRPASFSPKVWEEAKGWNRYRRGNLHLPLPLRSLSYAPDLRRSQRRVVLCAPAALQHAPSGPDDSQRTGFSGSGSSLGLEDTTRREETTGNSGSTTLFAVAWHGSPPGQRSDGCWLS